MKEVKIRASTTASLAKKKSEKDTTLMISTTKFKDISMAIKSTHLGKTKTRT